MSKGVIQTGFKQCILEAASPRLYIVIFHLSFQFSLLTKLMYFQLFFTVCHSVLVLQSKDVLIWIGVFLWMIVEQQEALQPGDLILGDVEGVGVFTATLLTILSVSSVN